MLRLLLPVLLALIGTGGGVAAAMFLTKDGADDDAHETGEATEVAETGQAVDATLPEGVPPCGPGEVAAASAAKPSNGHGDRSTDTAFEYFKINNQFVVPLVSAGRVASLVVASVSLEIYSGTQDQVFAVEPRLRDAFLQVLFDHANLGGFDGAFTSGANMRALRTALRIEAERIVGSAVSDVLITDIVRQDAEG